MKNLIKEVEDKTLIRISNLVEFYKTSDRFPEQNRIGEEDLSEIACHVRHCESSNFGYPSLMDRYPEQCKMILEKEKEIIIRKRVNELNDFFAKQSYSDGIKFATNFLFWFSILQYCRIFATICS